MFSAKDVNCKYNITKFTLAVAASAAEHMASALLLGFLAFSSPPWCAARPPGCPSVPLVLRGGDAPPAADGSSPLVLRIRTSAGVKRLQLDAGSSCTLAELAAALAAQHKIALSPSLVLSRRAAGADPVDLSRAEVTLADLGLEHGAFLHLCTVAAAAGEEATGDEPEPESASASDKGGASGPGTSREPPAASALGPASPTRGPGSGSRIGATSSSGRSPGVARRVASPAGPVKRTWQQIEDERKAKTVEMKAPPKPRTAYVAVDRSSSRSFAEFALSKDAYEPGAAPRAAALYGRVASDDKGVAGVWVDIVHEVPLAGNTGGEDEALAAADAVAARLGLARVGAAFTHPPRAHKVDPAELLRLCALARSAQQGPAGLDTRRGAKASPLGEAGERAGASRRGGGAAPARRRVGGGVVNAMAGGLETERSAPPGFVALLFRPVYADERIDGLFTAEAFEPTAQCEELCARGALIPAPAAGEMALAPGESFKVEGRLGVPSVDTAYFAVRIFDSGRPHSAPLRQRFPLASRGADVRKLHLRSFLTKEDQAGVPFDSVAADFGFLLHASSYLPDDVLGAVCDTIAPALRGKSLSPRQKEEARRAMAACERLSRAHAGLPPPEDEEELESPLAGCLAGVWRAVQGLLSGGGPGSAAGAGGAAAVEGLS